MKQSNSIKTMAKFINKENKEVSEASVIMNYFGRKDGQTISSFHEELKALTPESKTELAIGAAKELDYSIMNS